MLIVGPTGAGKSVLLALMALQFRRYAGSQVYIFDKGYSARAAVLAMGGAIMRWARMARWRSSRCATSTIPPSAAGRRNGSARCSTHEKVARHARSQGSALVGADQSWPRRRPKNAR